MGRFKPASTECKKCGVVYDEQNPKQKKRALCVSCYNDESLERNIEKRKYDREHRVGMNRTEKYKDYKFANRQPFWTSINKEIRKLKDKGEIRAFISKQMDRIIADKQLKDYINDTDLVERNINKNNV